MDVEQQSWHEHWAHTGTMRVQQRLRHISDLHPQAYRSPRTGPSLQSAAIGTHRQTADGDFSFRPSCLHVSAEKTSFSEQYVNFAKCWGSRSLDSYPLPLQGLCVFKAGNGSVPTRVCERRRRASHTENKNPHLDDPAYPKNGSRR